MYSDSDWDMAETVQEIRCLAAKLAKQAMQEDMQSVFMAWKVMYFMEKTADQEGLLALENQLEYLQKAKVPFYEFLKSIVYMMVDGTPISLILEVMTNDFYTRKREAVTVLILYFYMQCVQDIEENFRAYLAEVSDLESKGENVELLSTAKRALDLMRRNLELIPKEYQNQFLEILK